MPPPPKPWETNPSGSNPSSGSLVPVSGAVA
eukprot:CAMPEP_0176463302 /NCGR_PEP_ID=MMETSP0127-20121128/35798_1 /TAXON_ID=938130 /ORGANISM="Platyophrya macrostoma, Strain WH" /LENGTH=30 /DNA_ID= /DNA_START= /DNA_END= /DNA_ORIENTATION=